MGTQNSSKTNLKALKWEQEGASKVAQSRHEDASKTLAMVPRGARKFHLKVLAKVHGELTRAHKGASKVC